MSRAIFDYSEMEKAASAAKKAADKLEDYRDELDKKVTRKLASYEGKRTSKVSSAASLIRSRQRALESKAENFRTYGESVTSLVRACKTTDSTVKRNISTLSRQFTNRHGISISTSEYDMMLRSVSKGNANLPARWLNDKDDQFTDWLAGKGRDLKYWYKYEGGKYAIWENVKAALKAVVAVATVVAAISAFMAAPLTGGSTLILAANIFTGVMALFDAGTDIYYNCKAAGAAKDDPVLAKQLDGVNDYTDALRRNSDSRFVHNYTNFLDITETVAKVITLASGIKDLAAKGYKWVTGGDFSVKDFKWLDKDNGFSLKAARNGFMKKFSLLKADLRDFKAGDFKTKGQTLRELSKVWYEYFKYPFKDAKDGVSGIKSLKSLKTIKDWTVKDWKALKSAADGIKFFSKLPGDLTDSKKKERWFNQWSLLDKGFSIGDLNNSICLSDVLSNVKKGSKTAKDAKKEIKYYKKDKISMHADDIWRINNNISVPHAAIGGTGYGTP